MAVHLGPRSPPTDKALHLASLQGPSCGNIAMRIPGFNMQCTICGHPEETDLHALFECPLSTSIWEGSELRPESWSSRFRCPLDCFLEAKKKLSQEEVGDFVAILWEIWNARNRFIFKTPDRNFGVLSKRAISFVRSYRESVEHDRPKGDSAPSLWQPPASGTYKLNFDGGCVGERGWGWGFVIRNSNGDVVMSGVQFAGPEIEEARACIFGLKQATTAGINSLVIEGDCLALIQKLRNKQDLGLGDSR
ncbi:hypothetical protein Cgig2_018175 [Carnegiea gigantea]|uniref:RNase H type-1 domain-containing protein n=1 Tax=Carnegiea gigantea TaxID=171969 RepID=A0A9Q1KV92_9CARY|nr:hypothetical protein Cgig2_018175 [Carnegiea gigantea]